MKFYMPVKVFDEPECVLHHAGDLASLGKKALIVTGKRSAARCGALSDVIQALEAEGRTWCHFSEVEENPSVETVLRAASFGTAEGADFVIGIGGGSPMDAAKAVAFCMKQDAPCFDTLYDASLKASWLPVAAIPTTCGTGSEVTGVSVLTVHEKKTKISLPHRIFPDLALIDGKYLKGAPLSLLVNTSVDALAHMIESYLSKKADDYSQAAVLAGLSIWSMAKPVLRKEREPEEADYQNLMRSAAFAGIAIAQTGTSIPHALSYILTYDRSIPHGRAAGYFLDAFLKEADAEDRQVLSSAAGFENFDGFSAFLENLFQDMEVPEDTRRRAFETVAANPGRMNGCRFSMDERVLARICRLDREEQSGD